MRIGLRLLGAALIVAVASGSGSAAEVETGVIRLNDHTPAPDPEPAATLAGPLVDARRGFDVQAFDGRFEGLWFQRKAYQTDGREEEAAKQSEKLREFVSDEGVRRMETPAGALLLEARGWMREGNYTRALATLSLAESLDPDRPQIQLARARALSGSGAGVMPAAAEAVKAARGTIRLAVRDLTAVHESALVLVGALLAAIALMSLFMILRYQVAIRHDVEEWLVRSDRESLAKAGGLLVVLLPFVVWIGAGWATVWWLVLSFRYMRRAERALAAVLLALAALAYPAYRFAVGLYGLAADPTIRTTIAAANGGYDPDRIVKLRELVDAHPDDPMYRFLLAGLYKNGRYFEEAFEGYKRVLQDSPSTYQARINLGNIYFLIGQYGEATSNYRQALETRPDSALAYYDMYVAQSDSFKLKEAAESLAKAREIDAETTTRLLTQGSQDAGSPKVVDAAIDFDSIWRATVEGRHLREWLDAGPEGPRWRTLASTLLNPLSLVALLGLVLAVASLAVFRGAPASRCTRCGHPFCAHCKAAREGHEYCNQCVHLFVLGDGLAPETKSMKLYEVERHERWGRRVRRIGSAVLPGAGDLLAGRAWVGFTLLALWILALVAGYPSCLAPAEAALGMTVRIADLRPVALPDVYGLNAATLLAIPLAALVWLTANVARRRMNER
ncbi:MAG TPA: tetratricopeptide repeat protein [Candidatus Polarisedimenticolaceae bacterium]|nr:tetratricopeptide repeat protein [Candidatus Polarisedimenticolaceae bacterium]